MSPEDSARTILDHVTHGVRLLAEYGVDERLADFVREHQGTGVLAVFQAKAEAGGHRIDPSDFQYPGPRPRSRETAVLMVADKIEATARSRGDATAEAFRATVNQTMDALQAQGQFDESPLTLRDLAALREAFVSALTALHHTRLDYPALQAPPPSASVSP